MEALINKGIRLINEFEVAELLRVSVKTVRRWRTVDRGPHYLKLGRLVKYRREAIDEFLDTLPERGGEPR